MPAFIKAIENGIDDPVEAPNVGEDHHRPGTTALFYEPTLDGVGGAQSLPQVIGEGVEVEQFGKSFPDRGSESKGNTR